MQEDTKKSEKKVRPYVIHRVVGAIEQHPGLTDHLVIYSEAASSSRPVLCVPAVPSVRSDLYLCRLDLEELAEWRAEWCILAAVR